jgi:hypothetical protein
MTDLSTAPASETDSPADHDAADVHDVGDSGAPSPGGQPDTASSVLARLDQAGWRSLHARTAPGQRAIDHITIGPGGIFVIDSHVVDAAGAAGQLSGTGSVSDATVAAANQLADAVRQLLPPLTRQYVVPVLAYVASAPMSISRGPVQICTTSMLQRVIESCPAALSSREIDEVFGVLTAGLGGPAPAAERSAPIAATTSEPRRAAPKRRKLGWRSGQADDTSAAPSLETAPQEPAAWPAVTPPPVWEPADADQPVAEPAPSWELEAQTDGAETQVVEPEAPVDEPEPEAPVDEPEPEAPVDEPEPEAVAPEAVEAEEPAVEPEELAELSALAVDPDEAPSIVNESEVVGSWDDLRDDFAGAAEAVRDHELSIDLSESRDDVLPEPEVPVLHDEATANHSRDPLVGSFPIGWDDATEVADLVIGADSPADASVIGVESDGNDEGADSDVVEDPQQAAGLDAFGDQAAPIFRSPWATIQLPDLTSDSEPDLGLYSDTDLDGDPALDADPHDEQASGTQPASRPTPVGRAQPGGRRRAPTAPWHERLTRTRPKSRPEGGRRVAPTADSGSDLADDAVAASTSITADPSPARPRSRRSTSARPRTLSARSFAPGRDADEPKRATRRATRTRSRGDDAADTPGAASAAPANLSSRGQKMYAAMAARQADGLDDTDEPTTAGAPIRRLITVGIAAGLIVVSGTHVTGISAWVADHVHIPGVGDTSGTHQPKDGDTTPGRSADLQSPDSGGKGNTDKGDSNKPAKP